MLFIKKLIVKGSSYDTQKPTIFVSNHYGFIDYIALRSIIPNTYSINKSDTFTGNSNSKILHYISDYLFKSMNFISYERGNKTSGSSARLAMKQVIRNGNNLIVFPEGKSHRYGLPTKFYPGTFEVAAEMGIPVVPVSIYFDPWSGLNKGDKLSVQNEIKKNITMHLTFHDAQSDKDSGALSDKCYRLIYDDIQQKMIDYPQEEFVLKTQ